MAADSGRAADVISIAKRHGKHRKNNETGEVETYFEEKQKMENLILDHYSWCSKSEEDQRKEVDNHSRYCGKSA